MTYEQELSNKLMEVIPPLMHQIRAEMMAGAEKRLTMPQFWILSSISEGERQAGRMADSYGVSQPAMSKMINGLVERGLVKRVPHEQDRRQIVLQITAHGKSLFESVKKSTRDQVSLRLRSLDQKQQGMILKALIQMENLFLKEGANL